MKKGISFMLTAVLCTALLTACGDSSGQSGDANAQSQPENSSTEQDPQTEDSTTVEDFDSYDTVFIGYPIWWHEAAWVVNHFVTDNDFTGKTVIPFCTSSSSGLGESGVHLAEMAGTGDWQEGVRFGGGAGESEVTDWLEGLDL